MKHILLSILTLSLVLPACTTLSPQQSALLAQAKPIATAALSAAGARYGVSPATTQMVIDSLYGAAAQAQASQPIAAGASNPTVGNAIAFSNPGGTPDAQSALLRAAAASIK